MLFSSGQIVYDLIQSDFNEAAWDNMAMLALITQEDVKEMGIPRGHEWGCILIATLPDPIRF